MLFLMNFYGVFFIWRYIYKFGILTKMKKNEIL
jgi:hypothetical protein